ncbi:MAG: S8 family serine peptidase, partial [Lentisphaeraceae bacterium]|nr:S8 family serine peptidase [Lentisphaeraceae bacterium]
MSSKKSLSVLALGLLSMLLIWNFDSIDSSQSEQKDQLLESSSLTPSETEQVSSKATLPQFDKLQNLESFEILDQRVKLNPANSKYDATRETLVKTNLKYPYIKIKESFTRNKQNNDLEEQETLIYSANQLIVSSMSSNSSFQDEFVENEVSEVGENIFLVSLNETTLDSVDDAISEKAGNPVYQFVEPNYLKSIGSTIPNDSNFSSLWGMNNSNDIDIDAPEAWQIQTGSDEITVGVIDTGVSYTHPDLSDNIWTNDGETGTDSNGKNKATNGIDDDGNGYIDDVYGWDFYNNDNNPDDDNGHGTHCAGTIGAEGNNNLGVAGVSWNVKIMPLK